MVAMFLAGLGVLGFLVGCFAVGWYAARLLYTRRTRPALDLLASP